MDTAAAAAPPPSYPLLRSWRLVFTICAFLNLVNLILLRYNLSFTLVCMVKDVNRRSMFDEDLRTYVNQTDMYRSVNEERTCYLKARSAGALDTYKGEFLWGKELVGRLNGGIFYGYIVTQAFAGYFCDRFGGKLLFVLGNALQSVCTLLAPVAARTHPEFLFAVRLLQGVCCGTCIPSMYVLFANWAAPSERTRLMGMAYTGFPLGNIIIYPLASALCQTGINGGWPMVFYVTGSIGAACSILFALVVYDEPNKHPWISQGEKDYLNTVIVKRTKKKLIVPWFKIMLSPAFHAYNVAHFCQSWGFFTLASNLPMLMKDMLNFSISSNGMLSALPYICAFITRVGVAQLFQPIQKLTKLSLTNMRKMNHIIGTAFPAAALIWLSFLNCNQATIAMFLIVIIASFNDVGITGSYIISYIDIAPAFTGLLTGISNTIGSTPGFISNTLTGYLTKRSSREEWVIVLYIMAGMYIFGGIFYTIFGTSELQSWAKEPQEAEE